MDDLRSEIEACTLCAERFAATATAHAPRPVVWFDPRARILVAGQAPGIRVHEKGMPFWDASGDRLRDWLGLDKETFYDRARLAVVPMAFCFPGYDAGRNDLPPPKICATTWRDRVMASLPRIELTILIGGYAQAWHRGDKRTVTARVADWRSDWPRSICLPHPSWRTLGWAGKNPWFEAEVIPALRARVAEVLA